MSSWSIDLRLLFQNYSNALKWYPGNELVGVIFADRATCEVHVVLFVPVDQLTEWTVRTLLNSLSPELEQIGVVWTKEETLDDLDWLSTEVSVTTTEEALKAADSNAVVNGSGGLFVDKTQSKRAVTLIAPISFTCYIRPKHLEEDVHAAVDDWLRDASRLALWNEERGILVSPFVPSAFKLETAKGSSFIQDHIRFTAMHDVSVKENSEKKPVPLVRFDAAKRDVTRISVSFSVMVPVQPKDDAFRAHALFLEAVERRLRSFESSLLEASSTSNKIITPVRLLTFLPAGWSHFLHLCSPQLDDSMSREWRRRQHALFNLSHDTPSLRNPQAFTFSTFSLLRSPHLSITNYKPVGHVEVVRGAYAYHHYMQDNMDDSGWGCAYRSLQTIWSWFVLNGFKDKPVPSHKEIQQCLVDIGDKDSKFVGSRQWIGSTEIGFVLESLLGIESKFIVTNSGSEVAERARELSLHFRDVGSPVMIGGGQLAHTILGVDFSEETGECKFLVLDPHYMGVDVLPTVISKGWCGWKPASFWRPDSFYNLILPQPPRDSI